MPVWFQDYFLRYQISFHFLLIFKYLTVFIGNLPDIELKYIVMKLLKSMIKIELNYMDLKVLDLKDLF